MRVSVYRAYRHAVLAVSAAALFSLVSCAPDRLALLPPTVRLNLVTDFGAKGDGRTDDTDALQRCITTVESTRKINYKASTGESSYPEVVFPAGTYLVSRPLVIAAKPENRGLLLRGQGRVVVRQLDPSADIFYFHNAYRHVIENIAFEGGRCQVRFFTRNLDCAHLTVKNCRFIGSADYAIDDILRGKAGSYRKIAAPYRVSVVDGLVRGTPVDISNLPEVFYASTMMRITQCAFIRCWRVLRAAADWACMDHCRIETHPDMRGAAIYSRGVLKLDRVVGLAHVQPGHDQRWIDNINAGLVLENVKLETDSDIGMCPVYNRRVYDNGGQYHNYVIVDGCEFKVGGSPEKSIVYCDEVPNMITIRNSRETSGRPIPALGFREPFGERYFREVDFAKLVRRSPELARCFGWELSMNRKYRISDTKRKHNFAYVVNDNNRNITAGVLPSMRDFVEPPLPRNIAALFRRCSIAVDCRSMRWLVKARINVRDFGARGDKRADDTGAIQRACDAAAEVPGTEILFPGGIYRVSALIKLPSRVSLRGLGCAVFMADARVNSVFTCVDATGLLFRNLAFAKMRTAVSVKTRPGDAAGILFDNCNFNQLIGPAVICLSGNGQLEQKNRTLLRITNSTFVRNYQVLISNAAYALFDYNWVTGSRSMKDVALFVNRGTLELADSVGVPGRQEHARQRWVDNNGSLLADNFRFGAEGRGFCNVVNLGPRGRVLIQNCWVHARGSEELKAIVYCREVPDIVALRSSIGIPADTQKMVMIAAGAQNSIQGRFFESGNTLPGSVLCEVNHKPQGQAKERK